MAHYRPKDDIKFADYESAEAQFRAIAAQPTGMETAWLPMQVLGAILLIPAAIGIMRMIMQRPRGAPLYRAAREGAHP